VHIVIMDENEAPWCTDAQFDVAENAALGQEVGSMTGDDHDDGDVLVWSIASQPPTAAGDATPFSISETTGLVEVSAATLDLETRSDYSVTFNVTDEGGLVGQCIGRVSLINRNERPWITAVPTLFVPAKTTTQVGPPLAQEYLGD